MIPSADAHTHPAVSGSDSVVVATDGTRLRSRLPQRHSWWCAFTVSAILILTSLLVPITPAEAATPQHRKVVTVSVASSSSTYGVLKKWRWSTKKGKYVRVGKSIRAWVGVDGVGQASEYISRTPAGVFTLTEAFGWQPDPGTRLPYRQVGLNDWWVSDVSSDYYNTMRTCPSWQWCGFAKSRSEQLGAISLYSHAVVIDYNRDPIIPGAGSAFFLHVSEGKPTQGCISIDKAKLVKLLTWLKPHADPVISIGVGRAAYSPIR